MDETLIDDTFGSQNLLAIIVPSGDIDAENELAKSLYEYTYEDEAIVENILSISTLGLYDYYDAFSLSVLFGVTEDLMTNLFVEMDQESAMLCDILDYLTTSDYISSLILTMSDEVELYYNEMQALTTKVDCDTMAMYLGISSETVESIYVQMGGELEYSMQEVAQMVVEHDLATSMYSDIQAQLDYAYQNLIYLENASTSLTFEQACEMYYYIPSSTLSGIYGTNVTMTIGELITIFSYYEVATAVGTEMTESCQNVYSLFVQLSQDELMTLVTLPEEYISLMLADKNTLSTYELFEYMYINDVISAFGDELIESLENYQVNASSAYSLLNSENYTRFIVQISIADTDENSYIAVKELKELTKEIYDEFYISGTSALYSDMSDDFSVDIVMINLISFLAIFLIIAITFKSLLIPIILSIVIQGSIWLNMGICMLTGNGLFFIVYVLVLCIQTGSTIDYAMLLTTKYTEHRITKNKLSSISSAMKDSLPTILTSGSILVLATLIIGLVSNMTIISSVGIMLARGTFISLTFISLFLPQILVLLDKPIEKTTLKYNPIH